MHDWARRLATRAPQFTSPGLAPNSKQNHVVMPGLVPGIHVLAAIISKDVDGRDEPGHDEIMTNSRLQHRQAARPRSARKRLVERGDIVLPEHEIAGRGIFARMLGIRSFRNCE